MFTDTVGFTASTQADEGTTLESLRQQRELVRPLLAIHHGREIKSTGDGFLVEFDSALKATQCAINIQRRIFERNAEGGFAPIQIRIGIHLGDVVQQASDILGDAVNIAARIEPLAAPGGICLSGAVYEQVRNKIPEEFEKLGPTLLKGLETPIHIYRVMLPWSSHDRSTTAPAPAGIAVLPFSNISADPKDEYFADGLTEELITVLSRLKGLRVIARTSVMPYKSTSKGVSQIGAELRVSSILEGSVRKAGGKLRITAQLIDVSSEGHLWAETYDRDLDDVFAIQTEVAERTAGALRLELMAPERKSIEMKPTSNIVAYDLYLRGLHSARTGAWEESIKFFEEAIREDPTFSLPYPTLANLLIGESGGELDPIQAFPRAKMLIDRALELDPNSSEAHTALGNLMLQHEQNWTLAEEELRRGISLNPSNANAHHWYGVLLRALRRYAQCEQQFRMAIELDPVWEAPRFWLIVAYLNSGDSAAAIRMAEAARESGLAEPTAHLLLGWSYALAGRLDDARREALLVTGPGRLTPIFRAILSAFLGRPEEAQLLVQGADSRSQTGYVAPTYVAQLYAALGETEKALEWLDRDFQSGNRGLWADYQWPVFDKLRDEPKFQSLLQQQNIPI